MQQVIEDLFILLKMLSYKRKQIKNAPRFFWICVIELRKAVIFISEGEGSLWNVLCMYGRSGLMDLFWKC
jgi:hypothetical protein